MLGIIALVISAGKLSFNLSTERKAALSVEKQLLAIRNDVPKTARTEEPQEIPLMDAQEVQEETQEEPNREYIGILSIPALGKTLPVRSTWSEELLKTAPCCYFGDLSERIVIAGHNYRSHFSGIGTLTPGEPIFLEDMTGVSHEYRVAQTEVLGKTEVSAVTESSWALTLFTCTNGGEKRVVVRCERVE